MLQEVLATVIARDLQTLKAVLPARWKLAWIAPCAYSSVTMSNVCALCEQIDDAYAHSKHAWYQALRNLNTITVNAWQDC